ncbi:MAG: leucine--tRNA ligase [Flavobacteriaceae bacterium]
MFYDFKKIEEKWQRFWAKNQIFKAHNKSSKPKFYVLDMFPYPSGAGLHVGHPLGYIASDIYSRYKRHKGFNVLHPQGYDSFGLPAEQYAIETGQHPANTTEKNIKRYREQLDRLGFSFDWSREIRTSNSEYYKWTQSFFLLMFNHYYCNDEKKARPIEDLVKTFELEGNKKTNAVTNKKVKLFNSLEWNEFSFTQRQNILINYRLAYLAEKEVNWCPKLGTVLANDEIINGLSERGGYAVIKKKMKQWSIRITAYADRLLEDLDLIDWPDALKEMQRNWIGKSKGARVLFNIKGFNHKIDVYTTRPDTIFGATFLTLAPELDIVKRITSKFQKKEVFEYIDSTSKKSQLDRMSEVRKITGVFTGAYALHPFTNELIPIWIGDYVLADYGTGAVMGVPCGDQRDYDFAKKFKISIINIFKNVSIDKEAFTDKSGTIITNSSFLDNLSFDMAFETVIKELEKKDSGKGEVNYKLRDAVFSRQRYWGEPIPIYYKDKVPIPLKVENLPLKLPEVENYLPGQEGAPPLSNANLWAWDERNQKVVENSLIDNKNIFQLELNTMPGWAGSSWYFYRYMDSKNKESFADSKIVSYWKDVDLYVGGSEHATGHLLYSRFWQKFLFDLELVPVKEYAKKLINQGMILGNSAFIYREVGKDVFVSKDLIKNWKDFDPIRIDIKYIINEDELNIENLKSSSSEFLNSNFIYENEKFFVKREIEKMSKSKYNVVNPDEICEKYGTDTLRMYEMFLGPIEQAKPWNTLGISGVHGFLKKLWRLFYNDGVWVIDDTYPSKKMLKILHSTIKKVTDDIESFSFNTCISSFMICVNELQKLKCTSRHVLEKLIILLSPFAPHISEELWEKLGNSNSISEVNYPLFDEKHLIENKKNYPISFNGKFKFNINLSLNLSNKEIEEIVLNDTKTIKFLRSKKVKKVIIVPNKIVNIVF